MGDCSCIYVVDDYEMAEFSEERIIKAHKEHKCGECGRIIIKGEQYENCTGKWGGEMQVYKTCIDCLSIREQFFCNGWRYGEILTDLWEHISEMEGEISGDCIASLTPKARGMVCDLIQEYWDENDYESGEAGRDGG